MSTCDIKHGRNRQNKRGRRQWAAGLGGRGRGRGKAKERGKGWSSPLEPFSAQWPRRARLCVYVCDLRCECGRNKKTQTEGETERRKKEATIPAIICFGSWLSSSPLLLCVGPKFVFLVFFFLWRAPVFGLGQARGAGNNQIRCQLDLFHLGSIDAPRALVHVLADSIHTQPRPAPSAACVWESGRPVL